MAESPYGRRNSDTVRSREGPPRPAPPDAGSRGGPSRPWHCPTAALQPCQDLTWSRSVATRRLAPGPGGCQRERDGCQLATDVGAASHRIRPAGRARMARPATRLGRLGAHQHAPPSPAAIGPISFVARPSRLRPIACRSYPSKVRVRWVTSKCRCDRPPAGSGYVQSWGGLPYQGY
jgi:hypothetical protein